MGPSRDYTCILKLIFIFITHSTNITSICYGPGTGGGAENRGSLALRELTFVAVGLAGWTISPLKSSGPVGALRAKGGLCGAHHIF